MIKKDFNWGNLHQSMVDTLKREFTDSNLYETIYKVKEGDIVVDIGASTGIFTHIILPQKPKHVFCLEPSKTNFPFLVQNTLGYPVTSINKAIGKGNGFSDWNDGGIYADEGIYETITFNTFIKRFGIKKIDFL